MRALEWKVYFGIQNAMRKIRNYFNSEEGISTELIVTIILVGIALILVAIFFKQIRAFVEQLMDKMFKIPDNINPEGSNPVV